MSQLPRNNHSFSHQHSVSKQTQQKHKKKASFYQRSGKAKLKTEEKQCSAYLKEPIISYSNSINLAQSVSKYTRKQRTPLPDQKKIRGAKHSTSVFNLGKVDDKQKLKSSNATKRKQSSTSVNQMLKEKTEDFKVLANCLEEYVKQERRNHSQANINEVMKLINAFNRSEIGPYSKPLERLISKIIESIEFSLPQPKKVSVVQKEIDKERIPTNQEHTVKKAPKRQQINGEVQQLEQNLSKLKYESKRLKNFFEQLSLSKQSSQLKKVDKQAQIRRLQQILKDQAQIIKELESSESLRDTFREKLELE